MLSPEDLKHSVLVELFGKIGLEVTHGNPQPFQVTINNVHGVSWWSNAKNECCNIMRWSYVVNAGDCRPGWQANSYEFVYGAVQDLFRTVNVRYEQGGLTANLSIVLGDDEISWGVELNDNFGNVSIVDDQVLVQLVADRALGAKDVDGIIWDRILELMEVC